MIKEIWSYIAFFGNAFSPAEAEKKTGLSFSEKYEEGDIGSKGRFKNKPFPFGHALLKAPETIDQSKQIEWLIDAVLPHKESLIVTGLTELKLHITYIHDSQCNLEFEPILVSKIADLGCLFTITCTSDE